MVKEIVNVVNVIVLMLVTVDVLALFSNQLVFITTLLGVLASNTLPLSINAHFSCFFCSM